MSSKLLRIDKGLTKYDKCWAFQKKLVDLRYKNKIPDCLILTEHEPVITIGRGTDKKNLLVTPNELKARNIDLAEIERGGDITFHGLEQVILYPIINLTNHGRDVHLFLRKLEDVVIASLKEMGLEGSRKEALTGVWVDNAKVAAIGVGVSHWITYHGLALNVNVDLDYFNLIIPCGIADYEVGSITGILGKTVDMEYAGNILVDKFAEIFGYEIEDIRELKELMKICDV
jgi:lipoate-protein ligase B